MRNPVFDIDNWREIFATLSQNKTRTFMTAFGIFWGTAILVILLGCSGGFKGFMMNQIGDVATNMAVVMSNRTTKPYRGFNKGMYYNLVSRDAETMRRSIPEIDAQSVLSQVSGSVTYGKRSSQGSLIGVEADYERIVAPRIYSGRFINEADDANARKVCVLGTRIANDLFGTMSPIGQEVCVNNIYYKVVGTAGQESDISIMGRVDDSVIIPNSTMRISYNQGDMIGAVMLTARRGTRPSEFEDRVRRIITSNHPIAPDDRNAITFFDVSSQFEMVDNLFSGINLLALFVGLGTLFSGIVGVGNIMWIIVRERTQEIGIRRAIGAKPRDIIAQILSEGMILTIVAGLCGITFSALVLGAIQAVMNLNGQTVVFQISFGAAVGILLTFTVLGTLAGLIPSVKAMRIKPVEALNSK